MPQKSLFTVNYFYVHSLSFQDSRGIRMSACGGFLIASVAAKAYVQFLEKYPDFVVPLVGERSKGYFPAYCIDNHPSGSNVNSSLHVRSKSIDRLVPTPLSSISRPVSTTNVDTGHLSQPVIPRRYKRFVKLSSSLLPPVPIKSQSSRSCTNLSSLATQNALSYTSKNRNVSVPGGSTFLYECHQFNNVSVSFPRLCVLCGDYVVTPRCNANQCLACKSLFHRVCAEFCKRFEKLPCRRETNTNVKGKPEKSANAYASDIFPLSSSSISTSEQVFPFRCLFLFTVGFKPYIQLVVVKFIDLFVTIVGCLTAKILLISSKDNLLGCSKSP
ncbi:unnamed protein product [Trichobilharzia regenti]|nr:unnamed protein product [Trichobilharzia regenti]